MSIRQQKSAQPRKLTNQKNGYFPKNGNRQGLASLMSPRSPRCESRFRDLELACPKYPYFVYCGQRQFQFIKRPIPQPYCDSVKLKKALSQFMEMDIYPDFNMKPEALNEPKKSKSIVFLQMQSKKIKPCSPRPRALMQPCLYATKEKKKQVEEFSKIHSISASTLNAKTTPKVTEPERPKRVIKYPKRSAISPKHTASSIRKRKQKIQKNIVIPPPQEIIEENFVLEEKECSTPEEEYSTPEKDYLLKEEEYSTPEKDYWLKEEEYSTPEKDYWLKEEEYSTPEEDYLLKEKEYSAPEEEKYFKPLISIDSKPLPDDSSKEKIIQKRRLQKIKKSNRIKVDSRGIKDPVSTSKDQEKKEDKTSVEYYEMKYKKIVPPKMIEPEIDVHVPENEPELLPKFSHLVDVWSNVVIDLLNDIPDKSNKIYKQLFLNYLS